MMILPSAPFAVPFMITFSAVVRLFNNPAIIKKEIAKKDRSFIKSLLNNAETKFFSIRNSYYRE